MTQDDNERWLDVLAGKAEPTDSETRQAAALRRIILEDEEALEPMDSATKIRMMNTLRARGAFDVPKPAKSKNPLVSTWAWLFPPGSVSVGRYAAVAALTLAVLAVPVAYQNWGQSHDDPDSIKSIPGETLVFAANPELDANALLALLARNGVVGTVRTEGTDRLLEAQVPADRLPQVHTDMMSMGLAVPQSGAIKVRFRRSP